MAKFAICIKRRLRFCALVLPNVLRTHSHLRHLFGRRIIDRKHLGRLARAPTVNEHLIIAHFGLNASGQDYLHSSMETEISL